MPVTVYLPELDLRPTIGDTITIPEGISNFHYQATFDSGIADDPQDYNVRVSLQRIRGGLFHNAYGKSGTTSSLALSTDNLVRFADSQLDVFIYVYKATPNGSGGWIIGELVEEYAPFNHMSVRYPGTLSLFTVAAALRKNGYSASGDTCLADAKPAEYSKSTISLRELLELIV